MKKHTGEKRTQRQYNIIIHWTRPIIGTKESSTSWPANTPWFLCSTSLATATSPWNSRSTSRTSSSTAITSTTKSKVHIGATAMRRKNVILSILNHLKWLKWVEEQERAAHQFHITDLVFRHNQSPSCCHALPEVSFWPLPLPLPPLTSLVVSSSPPTSSATTGSTAALYACSSLFFDSAIKTPIVLPWKSLLLNHSTAATAACGSSYVTVASPFGSLVSLSRYNHIFGLPVRLSFCEVWIAKEIRLTV